MLKKGLILFMSGLYAYTCIALDSPEVKKRALLKLSRYDKCETNIKRSWRLKKGLIMGLRKMEKNEALLHDTLISTY